MTRYVAFSVTELFYGSAIQALLGEKIIRTHNQGPPDDSINGVMIPLKWFREKSM